MATIVFPAAPTPGQVYNAPNGITYVWDGEKWVGQFNTVFATMKTGLNGSSVLPTGTTAQRDASPSAGFIRWNTSTPGLEVYDGTAWSALGGSFVPQTLTTGSAVIPTGTTAQRDATPATGYFRYNTTTPGFEYYDGAAWTAFGGGGGGGMNAQIFQTDGTFTVPAGVTSVGIRIFGGGAGGSSVIGGMGGMGEAVVPVTAGTTIAVTVGAGGAGAVWPGAASPGGTSSFGTLVSATGGSLGGATFGTVTVAAGGILLNSIREDTWNTGVPFTTLPSPEALAAVKALGGGAYGLPDDPNAPGIYGGGGGMSGGGGISSSIISAASYAGLAFGSGSPGVNGIYSPPSVLGGAGGGPKGGAGGVGSMGGAGGGGGGGGGVIVFW